VSTDETNQDQDVEAAVEPKTDAVEAAAAPEAEKADAPQAEAPVAPPADEKPAEVEAAEEKPAAKKPAVKAAPKKSAGAAAKPAEKKAAKPAAKKAAAAKPAARKAAAKKPAAKAKAVEAAAKHERPPRVRAEKREAPETRHGKEGVATVVDAAGKQLEERDLNPALFSVPADVNTLHLVVRAEQAARRRGTASTKTRGMVSGSTAKLYRQKGTGRARAGSVKSPVRTGGGIVFGPHPRSFDIKVNRKVVRKALAMALSNRAENGNVFVASGLSLEQPSTAAMNAFLVNLDIGAPVLVVTHDEPAVAKSVRNLRYADVTEVGALSTEQVLRARSLVLTEKAFAALNEA
jgi:large subunit ribosomal protein L4